MDKFADLIIKNRRTIIVIFLVLTVICGVLAISVRVNYNLEDYLPKNSNSTKGMNIMKEEFDEDFPSASVMIRNISIHQALEYKKSLEDVPYVTSVTWLDDAVGLDVLLSTPLEYIDKSISEAYYKNNNALFSISIVLGHELEAVNMIYEIIGQENAASGSSVNNAVVQKLSSSETIKAMLILIPLIILILLFTTSSYIEPVIYLVSIGIAILINMGTNIFFNDISFITKTVSPILQLAVSLDYAIFVMHSFQDYQKDNEPEQAMKLAIKKSFVSVFGSAATTVIGFLALAFMRFEIGMDLGINLVKGVVLSFLSIMIFLPVVTLSLIHIIDKTRHKSISMDSKKAGKWLMKLRIPLLILSLIIIIPSFLAKGNIEFQYGASSGIKSSKAETDKVMIEEEFGKINQMVILVPKDNMGSLSMLTSKLDEIDGIKNIISYDRYIGSSVPEEFVKGSDAMFNSKNYTRIILYTNFETESAITFSSIEKIKETIAQYFNEFYLIGESASVYDIKQTVTADNTLVTLIAVLGIFLVLLFTFKSISIPFILVLTIESAIWINLAFTYFQDKPLNYIGFLVINTVQLGATVDYAILLTDRYMHDRTLLSSKDAMAKTLTDNLAAIMISAGILSFAGFTLTLTSSNPIVSELGILLSRGTILSFAMVSSVLPALLILFDYIIKKTTYKNGFHIKQKTKGPR
ncbi:MAG: putative membrane protein YdgH [Firmicutes bacterium ADurb.Bin146]|nr:MAG: putative membrane protein YdgH [Firmicutes bacterium ADurb.Bin146]